MAWLSGLKMAHKFALGLIVMLFFVSLIMIGRGFVNTAFDTAEEKGASGARADSAEKGLGHVESANKAAGDVARDDDVRKSGCMRYSRTPANC